MRDGKGRNDGKRKGKEMMPHPFQVLEYATAVAVFLSDRRRVADSLPCESSESSSARVIKWKLCPRYELLCVSGASTRSLTHASSRHYGMISVNQ